jgi:phosphoribosylaminoimidazolecarboxamide formyltransferase / IMP cyclohydrolase
MKYALISVYDKTGITDFVRSLASLGYQIISTAATAKVLQENKIKVIPIQDITNNPESFSGRMKTISFQIGSGILFDRTNPEHIKQAQELKIKPIDIVVCNLYPFEKKNSIENIDIGGPTILRAAAKNYKSVLAVTDPNDYKSITEYLQKKEILIRQLADRDDIGFRKELAAKAFAHVSFYDAQVAKFLEKDMLPEELTIPGRKMLNLRYGENPHQKAGFYTHPNTNSPLTKLHKQWGRELSLVNLTDINAGLESVRMFEEPAAVVIKHNSPCGIALGKNTKQALERAIDSDPESAFGGIIVTNQPMDIQTAKVIGEFKDNQKSNIDIVAVPEIKKNALKYLTNIRKSMGIYTFGQIPLKKTHSENIKWIDGGFILQTEDLISNKDFNDWTVVTSKKPSKKQMTQMQIAWKFISRVRSNAVLVIDKNLPMTRGIGSGQTSRIRSTEIALDQAGKYVEGAILASDSFFPFDDSVKLASKFGIAGIVQQGGSVNDKMSIKTADKLGIFMVLTHKRAFWH